MLKTTILASSLLAATFAVANGNEAVQKEAAKAAQTETAKVITIHPGKGRYRGMMGSMTVENSKHGTFKIAVGFKHTVRKNPPSPGSRVEYSYRGRTSTGKPKRPAFVRLVGDKK